MRKAKGWTRTTESQDANRRPQLPVEVHRAEITLKRLGQARKSKERRAGRLDLSSAIAARPQVTEKKPDEMKGD